MYCKYVALLFEILLVVTVNVYTFILISFVFVNMKDLSSKTSPWDLYVSMRRC